MRTEMEMPRTVRTQNKMNKHRPHFSSTSPFCGLQPSLSVRTALCSGRHHRRWMRAERLDRSAGTPHPPAPVRLPSTTLSSHVRWQSSQPSVEGNLLTPSGWGGSGDSGTCQSWHSKAPADPACTLVSQPHHGQTLSRGWGSGEKRSPDPQSRRR